MCIRDSYCSFFFSPSRYIAAQSTVSTPNPIRRPVIRLSYHVFSFSICVEVDIPSIAFEFASWVSPQFKLYLIKEFERLKKKEQALLGWSAKRELAKINYRIHTDAIKTNLIPAELTPQQTSVIYASEADVLNMALFGMTAKQWREEHPDKKGNIRDYASINELICLSNMENINAVLIEDGLSQKERLIKLNKIAIHQMSILEEQNPKVLK